MTIANPWNLEVSILAIHHDVFLTDTGQKIAHIYENIEHSPILIPANATIVTTSQPVQRDGLSFEEWRGIHELN
jgi:hypothetical protein